VSNHKAGIYHRSNAVNEETKEWLECAYRTMQKAWREQGSDEDSVVAVVLTAEEFRALEDAITLALAW
jgi:hypothetical protein